MVQNPSRGAEFCPTLYAIALLTKAVGPSCRNGGLCRFLQDYKQEGTG
jgi:hypothetical protein